jgi:type I restriction enzyme S subunit
MSEWKEYKIEDFCEVIGGGTPSTKEDSYYGGEISWITPRDLTNHKNRFISRGERNITELGLKNSSARILPKNSILLTSRAPIGYLAIAEREVCTNQGFKSLIVNPDKANYNFVYYLIKSNIERIKGLGTGTTFAEISGSVVKNLKFSLPDLPTQTSIAEILSSLDDKIELNNKINQELETLAQTLFKQWFIDFEFPNENGEPYKSSGGEMMDSELGKIPKGWEVITVSNIEHKLQTGTRPKGGVGGILSGVPSIGAESVKGLGFYDFSKIKYVSNEFASKMKRGKVDGYELLIYKDGGKPGTFIPHFTMFGEGFPFEKFFINEHVFLLDFFDKNFNSFCYFYFDSEYVIPVFENNGGKAAIPGINQEDVKNLKIFNPENSLVKTFGKFAKSSISTILINCKENIQLINLRDNLLSKLISGELEINETKN